MTLPNAAASNSQSGLSVMSFLAFHVVFEQVVIDSICILLDCFILTSCISTFFKPLLFL